MAAFDSIDRVAKFGEAARLLHAHKLREPGLDNPTPLTEPLENWSVESIATDNYIAANTSPLPTIVLVVGLFISAVLALYAKTLLGRKTRSRTIDCSAYGAAERGQR